MAITSIPEPTAKLSLREKLCYGSADFGVVLYWQTFQVYLLYFYTDVFGLSAATAGTLFLVTRVLDGALDPVVGMMADRTETRWGKFRPYLLWFSGPMAVMGVLVFTVPALSATGKLAWAYASYVGMMLCFTLLTIPYTTLLGVITPNPSERTALSSIKFCFAFGGGLMVSATLLPMVGVLGAGDASAGWQRAFLIYGVVFGAILLNTFLGTRERVRPSVHQQSSLRSDLGDLARNRAWLVLALITVVFLLGQGIRGTVSAHYFKYFVGTQSVRLPFSDHPSTLSFETLVSAWGGTGQAAAIVGILLLGGFTRLVGKKRALVILLVVMSASTGIYCLLRPDQIYAMFIFNIIGSLSGGPICALLWSMYADAADFGEWTNGRRATGLVFSASIMGTKFGAAVGSAATGWLLAWVGYQPNVAASPQVRHGLVLLIGLIPAALWALSLLLALLYPLDEARLAGIGRDLAARRAREEGEATAAS